MAALHTAVDQGINFFDTADVYGDGRSERLLARLKRERSEEIIIPTKVGRRLDPHTAEGYNRKNLTKFVDRSLKNLETDSLDLVQLHCPPWEVYYTPEVFGIMDDLGTGWQDSPLRRQCGKKSKKPSKRSNTPTSRPCRSSTISSASARLICSSRSPKNVISASWPRVPLASGLLTGKMTTRTTFEKDDHRAFNRKGEAFDRGETFSGVDYATGLQAVEELRPLVPAGMSMAQFALRWILMNDAVSCVIPGGKRPSQVIDNAAAADLPDLDQATMDKVKAVYDQYIRPQVHQLW